MLILSAVFLIRLLAALQLPDLPLTIAPAYLAFTGAFWGIGSSLLALGLLTGRAWSGTVLPWGAAAFITWYWTDRLLFAQSEYAARSWPFALGLTGLGLGWIVLMMRQKSFREYFEESTK